MAIAFDAKVDQTFTIGGTSLTFAHVVGSGSNRLLVVGIEGNLTTDNITGVTYAGVSMTLVAKFLSLNSRWEYMFYLLNPTSGSNNVVISSNATTNIVAASASYTGVKQSGQPDASSTADQLTGTNITGTVTVVAANSWLIAFGSNQVTNSPTAGANTTIRTINARFMMDSNSDQAAGSRSMNYDIGSSGSANMTIASFAPFAVSGPTNVKTFDGVTQSTGIKTYGGVALASVKSFDGIT